MLTPQEEILEQLNQLKDEVIKTRHVVIKNDHILKNLGADIKGVTIKQSQQERKTLFNSATAYLIFVILIFIGLYLTFQAKLDKQLNEHEMIKKQITSYQKEIEQLTSELGRWQQIEKDLLEFQRLVKEGQKEEAVVKFVHLQNVKFAGLLQELINQFNVEVAQENFNYAVKLYEQGNFKKALEIFDKTLSYHAKPSYLGSLYYYQGMSLLKLDDYEKATEILKKAQDYSNERGIRIDIEFHLAKAHDLKGDKQIAKTLYQRFYFRYRQNEKHKAALAKQRFEALDK
jgi:tetratricopeptide (TPR) repeat protein